MLLCSGDVTGIEWLLLGPSFFTAWNMVFHFQVLYFPVPYFPVPYFPVLHFQSTLITMYRNYSSPISMRLTAHCYSGWNGDTSSNWSASSASLLDNNWPLTSTHVMQHSRCGDARVRIVKNELGEGVAARPEGPKPEAPKRPRTGVQTSGSWEGAASLSAPAMGSRVAL